MAKNDEPQYLWGKPNPNWKGPQSAHEGSIDSSAPTAVSDFVSIEEDTEDEIVSIDDANFDTKISNIDFSDYSQGDPFTESHYGNSGPDMTMMYEEDGKFHYTESWSDNPQSTISNALGLDGESPLVELIPDEAYSSYDTSLGEHLSSNGVDADFESLEYDYQRWEVHTSRNIEDSEEETIQSVAEDMNNAYNTFEYQMPSSVDIDIRESVEGTEFPKYQAAYDNLDKFQGDYLESDDIVEYVDDLKDMGYEDTDSIQSFSENLLYRGHNSESTDEFVEEYVNDFYGGMNNSIFTIDENSDKSAGTQIREQIQSRGSADFDPVDFHEVNGRTYVTRVF